MQTEYEERLAQAECKDFDAHYRSKGMLPAPVASSSSLNATQAAGQPAEAAAPMPAPPSSQQQDQEGKGQGGLHDGPDTPVLQQQEQQLRGHQSGKQHPGDELAALTSVQLEKAFPHEHFL